MTDIERYDRFHHLMKMMKSNIDHRIERCLQTGKMKRVEKLRKCYGWTLSAGHAAVHNLVGLGCMRVKEEEETAFKEYMEKHNWKDNHATCMDKVVSIRKTAPDMTLDAQHLMGTVRQALSSCPEDKTPCIKIQGLPGVAFNAHYLEIMIGFLGLDHDIDVGHAPYGWPSDAEEYIGVPLYVFSNGDKDLDATFYLVPMVPAIIDDECIVTEYVPLDTSDPLSFFF